MAKRRALRKKKKPAHKAALPVANTIPGKTERELSGERRLQELNSAMEKRDDQDFDEDSCDTTENIDGLPRRDRSDDEEGAG
jgi:hypothetical protein